MARHEDRHGLLDRLVTPPYVVCIYSSTAVASISIRKSATANADTPIQVLAGRSSLGKNSRSAPPTVVRAQKSWCRIYMAIDQHRRVELSYNRFAACGQGVVGE